MIEFGEGKTKREVALADEIERTFRRLSSCVEHGGIHNGFPTRIRLNDKKARAVLQEFADKCKERG